MRLISTASAREAAAMDTAALRETFLVSGLFTPGDLEMVLTESDRLLIGSAVPVDGELTLPPQSEFGTEFFAQRREIGVFNLGGPGKVMVDAQAYELDRLDCLYIGKGHREIVFDSAETKTPARFFFASCPAHAHFPTRKLAVADVPPEVIGDASRASVRRLHKFIHPHGLCSAQLTMGFTEVQEGSAWNTMPPHTHLRRSEIYLYFDLSEEVVVHLMGSPQNTRHLIVRDNEAVLSPPWSIHMGAGTGRYRFIWVMAGENQEFTDMDPAPLSSLY